MMQMNGSHIDLTAADELPDLSSWGGLEDALRVVPDPGNSQDKARSALINELASSPDENNFRCIYCNKEWALLGFFMKHIEKNHDIEKYVNEMKKHRRFPKNVVVCALCYGQVAKEDLLHHYWYRHIHHSQTGDPSRPCHFCRILNASAKMLMMHLRVIHFNELYVKLCQPPIIKSGDQSHFVTK